MKVGYGVPDSSLPSWNWPLSSLQDTEIQFYRLQVYWKAFSSLQDGWILQVTILAFPGYGIKNSQIQFTGKSITPPLCTFIRNSAEFHALIIYLHWRGIFHWADIERLGYIQVLCERLQYSPFSRITPSEPADCWSCLSLLRFDKYLLFLFFYGLTFDKHQVLLSV